VFIRVAHGRGHLEDLGIDGKIILEWLLGKWGGKIWPGFIRPLLKTWAKMGR
jgi:hypothetical protein